LPGGHGRSRSARMVLGIAPALCHVCIAHHGSHPRRRPPPSLKRGTCQTSVPCVTHMLRGRDHCHCWLPPRPRFPGGACWAMRAIHTGRAEVNRPSQAGHSSLLSHEIENSSPCCSRHLWAARACGHALAHLLWRDHDPTREYRRHAQQLLALPPLLSRRGKRAGTGTSACAGPAGRGRHRSKGQRRHEAQVWW
jgi:hypothetical protein